MDGDPIRMSLEEFDRGFVGPPTVDDVSITIDGRRLDSAAAVIEWWSEVASRIDADEAAKRTVRGVGRSR
jgi:hypothetical protein